jgi:RNA polymerase sigma-70 factor (ECF subfamily)
MSDPSTSAQGDRRGAAATLGDVLYAQPKDPPSEHEWAMLVARIAQGEATALHALYDRTHRMVFTLMMRLSGDRQTAEDLTLEAFHDLWRSAREYEPGGGGVLAWTMMRARACALARLGGAEPGAGLAANPDPRAARELAPGTRALHAALAGLTSYERQAIETTYFEGLTHAEAAARLHQPPGAIKTRIRSGLHKLREALAAEAGPQ